MNGRGDRVRRIHPAHARGLLAALVMATMVSCASPETRRVRDSGPGADIGNTKATEPTARANPQAADTTLWPGRATAPVDRLARGEILPPAGR